MRKVLLLVLILSIGNIYGEKRIALLIANGTYENFSSLKEPVNESKSLASVLSSLGFDVELVIDGSREDMLDALDNLKKRVDGEGGIVFFHYGGHGVQVDGKNYLIPSDANIPDERKVTTRAVDIDEVMISLDYCGSDSNIVILDACRNNPLPSSSGRSMSRGLSVVASKPSNSIIVYSAEAGTVAQDGLYTPALVDALLIPNISFSDVLLKVRQEVYSKSNSTQIPGEYNQLFNKIYLNGESEKEIVKTQTTIETVVNSDISELLDLKGHGLNIPFGGKWSTDSDESNGGKSSAQIVMSSLEDETLRMSYKLASNKKLGYKYAVLKAVYDKKVDYSQFSEVVIKVRGNNQNFQFEIMSDSVQDYGYHHSEKYIATKEWSTYIIPLNTFSQDDWAKPVKLKLTDINGVQIMINDGRINKNDFIEVKFIKLLK